MKRALGIIVFYMSLAALAQVGPGSSVSQVEKEFLDAAYSRLTNEFAEQQRRDDAELVRLRKAEDWAKQTLADASMERRAAAKDVADQPTVYGQGSGQYGAANKAAEARFDRAADREEKARAELQQRDNERRNAESMAKDGAERRRMTHLELTRLRQEFGLNPSNNAYKALEAQFQTAAADNGIYCNVTWKSSPKLAAVINYQTKRSRERGDAGVSLRDVTETKEAVLMGVYYVWATRAGKPTSDPDRLVSITQKNTVVTIVEDR